jgi:hypothetical protein
MSPLYRFVLTIPLYKSVRLAIEFFSMWDSVTHQRSELV